MSLWRHHDFLRLWAGQTVSGSQVTQLALLLAAVLTLHASALQMGFLSAGASLRGRRGSAAVPAGPEGRDCGADGGGGEYDRERLPVDLPELPDRGEKHGEHEREDADRGRERAHQVPGPR